VCIFPQDRFNWKQHFFEAFLCLVYIGCNYIIKLIDHVSSLSAFTIFIYSLQVFPFSSSRFETHGSCVLLVWIYFVACKYWFLVWINSFRVINLICLYIYFLLIFFGGINYYYYFNSQYVLHSPQVLLIIYLQVSSFLHICCLFIKDVSNLLSDRIYAQSAIVDCIFYFSRQVYYSQLVSTNHLLYYIQLISLI